MDAVFYYDGEWLTQQPQVMGPMDQGCWLGTVTFDGARAVNGMVPDLDLHCQRLIRSTKNMLMNPTMSAEEITDLCQQAVRKLPKQAAYYIRPMYFAKSGFLVPDPDSATFVLAVYNTPMPQTVGLSICLSSRRRPAKDMAPTDAKAGCLYPNTARALKEALDKGFDNCVIQDPNGNVAELATANIWIVKDGVAMTPMDNGTFLSGVTRNRVAQLLRDDGVPVRECTLTFDDLLNADEIFSTGNYGKVMPVVKIEDRDLQRGPISKKADTLYWDYGASHQLF